MILSSYHASGRLRLAAAFALAASSVLTAGCGSSSGKPAAGPPACRNDAADDVEVGARTGASGVKTGATTAVEGVKTFGAATVGLVEGGSDEAKTRWKKGAVQTKETARKGGAETKQESDVPQCK